MDCDNISCYSINPKQHHLLNKNLPEEVIRHIVSYLSTEDLFTLCCSNLFSPCLRNSPWFFQRMKKHFAHIMFISCFKSENLFTLCTIKPAILNNSFYFSIDKNYLPFFASLPQSRTLSKNKDQTELLCNPFEPVLSSFSALFLPYSKFKKLKKNPLPVLKSRSTCHSKCLCTTDHYIPIVQT